MNLETLASALDFVTLQRDAPSADLTTWRVGGPIALLARVDTLDQLRELAALIGADVPVLVVGRGSNLLIADRGFAGLGIVLGSGFELLAITLDTALVRAGGAVPLPVLARRCAAVGAAGLEFYVGIPGSVGGAIRMNAGGHGRETSEVVAAVTSVVLGTGDVRSYLDAAQLDFGYRTSSISAREIVTEATFRVTADEPRQVEERTAEIVRWRREHQPGGANAGSVFTNPAGDSAGRLIDACGLKGLRVGSACVSAKHANFIQADSGGRADDVRALIAEVRNRVYATSGIALEPEVQMVAFEHPLEPLGEMRP